MTRYLPILLSATALGACSTAYDDAPAVTAGSVVESEVSPGQAELGNYGFDMTGMDLTVDPGDDFYAYANGNWAKRTTIPEDKTNYGAFTVLTDLSEKRTQAIIDELVANPQSRVGIAYSAYLDTDRMDMLGLDPIRPIMAQIDAIDSFEDYARTMGALDRIGVGSKFFGLGIGQDDGDSTRYLTSVRQAGLSLPDRDFYLDDSERHLAVRAAFVDMAGKMLSMLGEDNVAQRASAILDYETQLAKVHWDRNKRSDAKLTYNLSTYDQLKQLAPQFDWDAFMDAYGMSIDEINIATPDSIANGAELATNTPLQVLKDAAKVSAMRQYAAVLPRAVDDVAFGYTSVVNGQPVQQERWKRGVTFVSGALRDDLGQVYAARYFPPATKAKMEELVDNVLDAMAQRIRDADWMAEATKAEALKKVDLFTVKIGYPDRWETYQGLTVNAGDAFGNLMRVREWEHEDDISRLGQPIRRWEWGLAPMTVNAYANFNLMEIVFPASILQPPFFDPNADPAYNYGGIGAVIGHEISHHFDDQGAKFDSKGNLNDWWTKEDYERFEASGKALIDQFDAYEVFPGEFVDGEFTLGENIGDIAGLGIAYDAYKASLNGKEAPVLEGLTGDQRFFLAWAQVWRRNYRDAELKNRLKVDSHAPSIQRVWIMRNMDAWYKAFDVTPDDAMYLSPEERVKVW